jgi:pyrimidine-nucleoside phosphorylase
MIPASIIATKRDGQELTEKEIEFMVFGYARGEIPDYQMSALAMAIYLRGMVDREVLALTMAMVRSGDRLRRIGDSIRVDKHSTGGLGDKTSLIIGLDIARILPMLKSMRNWNESVALSLVPRIRSRPRIGNSTRCEM